MARAGMQFGVFVGGAEAALGVAYHLGQRAAWVVGEEQVHVARQLVFEEGALLVDQQFGVAVVAHGDRHVHPRPTGDQVGAEHHPAVRLPVDRLRTHDFRQQQPRGVAIAVVEAHAAAQRRAMVAFHQLQPPAGLQQLRQSRDETGAVARMRFTRAPPVAGADHEGCIREQQPRRCALLPRREQPPGMVEVQVREHHHVDVLVLEAGRVQRLQQHVARLLHAVALAQGGFEERADPGFEQHRLAVQRRGQQGAAGKVDAVVGVDLGPAFPHRLRRVAEHRAAVELLRIA